MGMIKEFKEFAVKGNVLDMAVGIIIGAAFGKVVTSLVNDIIMPPIGLILGKVDFSNLFIQLNSGATKYQSVIEAQKAGAATLNYGMFISTVNTFVIVAFAVFILIKQANRLKRMQETAPAVAIVPDTKECPQCLSKIPAKATRCAFCTSPL